MRGRRANWLIVLVFILFGLFIGNRVGDALTAVAPVFSRAGSLALEPRAISLLDFAFTFGFSLKVNLAGAIGGLGGILLSRRI